MPADQNFPPSDRRRGDFRHDIAQMSPGSDRHPHCIALRWHMRSVARNSKPILGCVIAALVLLASGRALGQGTGGTITTGTGGVTGSLALSDFTAYFEKYNGSQWIQMNATSEQQYFFNRARCECDTNPEAEVKIVIVPGANTPTKISTLLQANLTATGGVGRLYAGNSSINCLTPSSYTGGLQGSCTNLKTPTLDGYTDGFQMTVFETSNSYTSNEIPVAWLFNALASPTCGYTSTCNATDSTSMCSTVSTTLPIFFWAQTGSSTNPDFQDSTTILSANLVGQAPYAPASVAADPGNNALSVSWTWPTGQNPATVSSFLGVQVFCALGTDTQVFADKKYTPAYMTSAMLCPDTAPTTSSYGAFSQLDKKYLCSGLLPPTASSYRITNLKNGSEYTVGVASIDKFGNISAIDPAAVVRATPIPTVDFYSEYRNLGGSAQGGYCALAGRHSPAGVLTILGLASLGLVLRLRRRRRRRPPNKGTLVLLIAAGTLTASQARAQTIYHDDFIVQDQSDEAWNGTPREFAIEVRFGLYTPNVDSEFGGGNTAPQPQLYTFGSKQRPMWQIEFDWEFLQKFGTLALGGVVGYYKENSHACKLSGLSADGQCADPSGDNTGLRLIPLAALLVYRMDEAANYWKIPLVPYAKFGLNYTIWTVTNGDGNVATYPSGGRGQGGTMGWQAAAGLSLQLDFLDPGAARGFDADAGVNHTYAFFELDHIDGSGLYRKDVLRVGDNTWFAGLMFEF